MISTLTDKIQKKGFMFHFPKVNYPKGTGVEKERNLASHNKRHNVKIIYGISIASVIWCSLILSYGIGLASYYPAASLPLFVPVSLMIIAFFPVCLMGASYVIYQHILQAQETGIAILEAARTLSSPALTAAEDVQSLSSSIAEEMGKLRHGLREIEDHSHKFKGKIFGDIQALFDAGKHLEESMENISQKIGNDRENMIHDIQSSLTDRTVLDSIPTSMAPSSPSISAFGKVSSFEAPPFGNSAKKVESLKTAPPYVAGEVKPIKLRDVPFEATVFKEDKNLKQEISDKISEIIQNENKNKLTENIDISDLQQKNTLENPPEEVKMPAYFSHEDMQPLQEEPQSFILRHQRQLYEGLYALTVDLNRVIGTNAPQELWPRYMRGDRNVFSDYLCAWVEENYTQYKQIVGQDEFQKISQRFITQFDTLRERLFDTPHAEVSEFLEKSAVGRIYTLLSCEYIQ